MAQQIINVGAAPDDGTGDPLRTAGNKINDNFTELYNRDNTLAGDITTNANAISANTTAIGVNTIAINDNTTAITGVQNSITGQIALLDGWAIDTFEEYTPGDTVIDKGVGWGGAAVHSGASIVSRNTYTGTENRLRINNGYFLRPLLWGSDWYWIKLAMLVRLDSPASDLVNPIFYFGFNSGTAGPANGSSTTNFVGQLWTGGGTTFTYEAVGAGTTPSIRSARLRSGFTAGRGFKRGTTVTNFGSATGSPGRTYPVKEEHVGLYLLELQRGVAATTATSVTYSLAYSEIGNNGVAACDYVYEKSTIRDVLAATDAINTSANVNLLRTISLGTGSLSWDESTGVIDSVDLSWTHSSVSLELSAIAIRKMY